MEFMNTLADAVIQVLVFTLIPFLWWLATARKKETFFQWIGLKKPEFKGTLLKLVLLAAVILLAYGSLMTIIMARMLGDVQTASSAYEGKGWAAIPAIFVVSFIQTALSEEIFFRGFLGKRLISRFGFGIGNTVQALLFGLIHGIPIGLAVGNVWVLILVTLLPGAIGWFQGWMNEKYSSGSIVPSWGFHALSNFLSWIGTAF